MGSLADYNGGRLRGDWVQARQEPERLHGEVLRALAATSTAEAVEFGILDYEGFWDIQVEDYPPLAVVTKLAEGIQAYGPPFAAWAQYLGPQQPDRLDEFEEHYRGEWPSTRAYVENMFEDIGYAWMVEEATKELPDGLKDYVTVDIGRMTADWETGLHVVERPGGGVWVLEQ